jgi:hypothetical protein
MLVNQEIAHLPTPQVRVSGKTAASHACLRTVQAMTFIQ